MFNRYSFSVLYLVFAITVAPVVSVRAQGRDALQTLYITSDSFFVVVLHPQQLLKYKVNNAKSRDMMLQMMSAVSGIDVRKLDQLVVQFGGTGDPNSEQTHLDPEEYLSMTFRFSDPIDRATVLASEMLSGTEKATHEKMTYYKASSRHKASAYFPDDRTMIIAKEPRLLKVMPEKQSMSTLVTRLRTSDASADMLILVAVDEARETLNEMFKDFPSVGEPFVPKSIIKKLDRLSFTAKLSADLPMKLDLAATDGQNAAELEKTAELIHSVAKTAFAANRKKLEQSIPKREIGKMVASFFDSLINGTKIQSKGNRVFIDIENKGGLPEAIEIVTSAMFLGTGSASGPDAVEAVVDEPKVAPVPKPKRPAKPKLESKPAEPRP